jgi:hypothetical protein
MWQADLSDMTSIKHKNGGNGWILFAIDVYSRYLWAAPIKRKTGESVQLGFSEIIEKQAPSSGHHSPDIVYVDQGSEFYNSTVKNYFKQFPIPIRLYSGLSTTKAALVERVQRTIKTRLWEYFTETGTQQWVNILPDLVASYNAAVHHSTKMAPDQVTMTTDMDPPQSAYQDPDFHSLNKLENDKRFEFKIDDVVRLSKQATTFGKGYLQQWTDEWFRIRARSFDPINLVTYYRLHDYNKEEPLKGTFYEAELQLVQDEEQEKNEHRVEKVVRRDKNAKKVLVKFKGWPEKYNEWVPESSVRSLS